MYAPCLVIEVREDNRVPGGECWHALAIDVAGDGERQQSRGAGGATIVFQRVTRWWAATGSALLVTRPEDPCPASRAGGPVRMSDACW